MRGLTHEEVRLLLQSTLPRDARTKYRPESSEFVTFSSLTRRGLLEVERRVVGVPGARTAEETHWLTPLGRLALRIHNAVSAGSAVSP